MPELKRINYQKSSLYLNRIIELETEVPSESAGPSRALLGQGVPEAPGFFQGNERVQL